MPQHTALQHTMNPETSSLSKPIDSYPPDDEHIRMLRFYLRSNIWVEEQISAELEVEITKELQALGKKAEDWNW